MLTAIIAIVLAYLIGSVNMSIIIAKLSGLPDPRTTGSGNAGATNTLRISGKKEAAYVLIGDIVKGVIAVVIGRLLELDAFMLGLTALAAVVGHIFPIFFQFKGGKGVATTLGVLLALNIWIGLFALAVWGLVAYVSKYASLASLSAAAAAIIATLLLRDLSYLPAILGMAVLITWKHKANINRLRTGNESKIVL